MKYYLLGGRIKSIWDLDSETTYSISGLALRYIGETDGRLFFTAEEAFLVLTESKFNDLAEHDCIRKVIREIKPGTKMFEKIQTYIKKPKKRVKNT